MKLKALLASIGVIIIAATSMYARNVMIEKQHNKEVIQFIYLCVGLNSKVKTQKGADSIPGTIAIYNAYSKAIDDDERLKDNPYEATAKAYCNKEFSFNKQLLSEIDEIFGAENIARMDDYATMKSETELEYRIATIARMGTLIETLTNLSKQHKDALQEELNKSNLPEDVRISVYSLIKNMDFSLSQKMDYRFRQGKKLWAIKGKIYQFMYDQKDNYTYTDSNFIFKEKATLNAYNELYQSQMKYTKEIHLYE